MCLSLYYIDVVQHSIYVAPVLRALQLVPMLALPLLFTASWTSSTDTSWYIYNCKGINHIIAKEDIFAPIRLSRRLTVSPSTKRIVIHIQKTRDAFKTNLWADYRKCQQPFIIVQKLVILKNARPLWLHICNDICRYLDNFAQLSTETDNQEAKQTTTRHVLKSTNWFTVIVTFSMLVTVGSARSIRFGVWLVDGSSCCFGFRVSLCLQQNC